MTPVLVVQLHQVHNSLRTGGKGYKKLEEGSLGVSVADRGRNGRKPFLRVAVKLVLDNVVVMQRYADDKCADESGWCIISTTRS